MALGELRPAESDVELFTDGACSGNPGPGGWGALLRFKSQEKELFGSEALTTNNRMEMMAVVEGLRALKRPCSVVVVTDSVYVMKGMTEWMKDWKRRGWKTADKKPVKNMDLWQALEDESSRHRIRWQWIRGHAGHPENERVDALARRAVAALVSQRKTLAQKEGEVPL